jgi:hypothetical protein
MAQDKESRREAYAQTTNSSLSGERAVCASYLAADGDIYLRRCLPGRGAQAHVGVARRQSAGTELDSHLPGVNRSSSCSTSADRSGHVAFLARGLSADGVGITFAFLLAAPPVFLGYF